MCVYFENKLIEEIERIIDVEEKKSHSSISQKIDVKIIFYNFPIFFMIFNYFFPFYLKN